MERYKFKKNVKAFESIYKNEKIVKCSDQKQKFHQHKAPISIKNIDINKIVVSNKVSLGKKAFEYFIANKDGKKLNPYVYFSQK